MQVHALKCFGTHAGTGNPALVIEHGPLDSAARREFARERILPCAFVDAPDQAGQPLRVDYYYPHMHIPLCVHSTLAVAAVLFARADAPPTIALETTARQQRLLLSREDARYFVRLQPQEAPVLELDTDAAARLLRLPSSALASAPRVGSVGSPKLLVEVTDTDVLYDLDPNLREVMAWSREAGVNGIYAWCRRGNEEGGVPAFEGRNFNHLDPSLEDSATGSAAGALCLQLGHDLVLHQGRAIWRDCLLHARMDGDVVLVGGMVEVTA